MAVCSPVIPETDFNKNPVTPPALNAAIKEDSVPKTEDPAIRPPEAVLVDEGTVPADAISVGDAS